jgi:hypothetical protein
MNTGTLTLNKKAASLSLRQTSAKKAVAKNWSCGRLMGWVAFAAGRLAEHVGAQIVAGHFAFCGHFNFYAIFGGCYTLGTIQPIPDIGLQHTNGPGQGGLAATKCNCFFKRCFHSHIIKQLFLLCQNNCGLLNKNTCFSVLAWR